MTVPSPTVTWRPSTHPAMMVTPSLIRDPSPITTYGPTNPPVPTMVCPPMTAVGCTPGGAGGTGYSNAIARANASRASLTRTAGLTMARRSCERSSAEAVLASASESRCASRTITSAPGTARPTSVTLVTTTSPSPTSSPPIATASSRSFMLPPRPSFESGQHHVCDIDAAESDGLLDQDHPQPPPACFIRHRGVDTFIELLFEITTQRSEFLQIRLPAAFQVLFTELPGEQTQIRHHSLLPVIELLLVGEPQHTLVDDPLGVHHPDPRSASGRHEKHTDNERNPSSRSRGVHRFSFSTTSVVMSIPATLLTNRVRTTSSLRSCAMAATSIFTSARMPSSSRTRCSCRAWTCCCSCFASSSEVRPATSARRRRFSRG